MEMDKLKQWVELAQKFDENDFWPSVFDSVPGTVPTGGQQPKATETFARFPCTDLYRTDSMYVLIVELPGVAREDIRLKAAGDTLYLEGERRLPLQQTEKISGECHWGRFERTIKLPQSVNGLPVSAKFAHGLLWISYPRTIPAEHQIPIE